MRVEKNVPLPEFGRSTYPFTSMAVGESVLVTDESQWRKVSNAAYMVGTRDGKKFKARKGDEGLRIWRTE